MGEGNNRFDTVRVQGVKHLVVELKPGFVRLAFVTTREETRPGNRHAEAFKAHPGEESDILFEVVVKVIALAFRVIFGAVRILRFTHLRVGHSQPLIEPALFGRIDVKGIDIGHGQPLAIDVPRPFELVCRRRATPQKPFRK